MLARPTLRVSAAQALAAAALALALGGCAGPAAIQGNDTGGIISWSPQAEREARLIAGENCRAYGKAAHISSIRRAPGNYITYRCRFDGPRRRGARNNAGV